MLALLAACFTASNKPSEFATTLDEVTSAAGRGLIDARKSHLLPGNACNDHPSVGALARRENGSLHCTGTLIRTRAVLTAAHCVMGLDATNSLVFVIGSDIHSPISQHRVTSVAVNATYKKGHLGIGDMAVLGLDSTPNVPWIPYRPEGLPAGDDEILTFVGFGYSAHDGQKSSGVKRCTDMSVAKADAYTFAYRLPTFGLCHGDSGGPAIQRTTTGDRVAGVTSWGDGGCEGTGTSVNVGRYAPWLDSIASSMSAPDVDRELDGDPVPRELCKLGDAPSNGKRCLIYVASLRTLEDATRSYETVKRRGVDGVGIWQSPSHHYVVTVCEGKEGPIECPAGKVVADRVRKLVRKDAGYEYRIAEWLRVR